MENLTISHKHKFYDFQKIRHLKNIDIFVTYRSTKDQKINLNLSALCTT